ncbi:hypothetical protein [Streptomyces lavendulocolor]|uniref:hypothetical protein n=1 Tax=Streptomyces lavendulocolor TaxID=67316 RepID=UPI003C307D02
MTGAVTPAPVPVSASPSSRPPGEAVTPGGVLLPYGVVVMVPGVAHAPARPVPRRAGRP